jgi:hypothetical protein
MKIISADTKAAMQSGVTTFCTCIQIVRRDGASFAFTDHDRAVYGQGVVYQPYNSFSRTSITSTVSLEVDQMEIDAILNSDAFAREEISSGLFDFANVEVKLVNYLNPTQTMSLRKGWIGEIVMNENNTFHAEIRGLSQIFTYRIGEPYSPECQADLGDNRCKIGLNPSWWKPLGLYRQGDFILGHVTAPSGYVTASATNLNFSSETDGANAPSADGWITYGQLDDGQWHFSSNWHGLTVPPTGGLFAGITDVVGTNVATTLGMYQDVDLVTSGLTTTDLDLGLCRVSFSGYIGLTSGTARAQLRLHAIDASGNVSTIWDTGLSSYAQLRWITLATDNTIIPAGTRKIRIDFYGTKKASEGFGAVFGGCALNFNDPNGTFNSDALSNGVMFQAQTGGMSGSTEPAFTNVINSTYTDGTVTWKAIPSFKAVSTVTTPFDFQSFTTTLPQGAGYYDGGLLKWETGKNAGRAMEVKTWGGGSIHLFQRTFYPIIAGDQFTVHPGCDKRRVTCISKFSNILNFRGFPDVPGQDAYMQTPDQQST